MTKATAFSLVHSGSRSYSVSTAEDCLSALNLAHQHAVTDCSPPYLLNSSLQICKQSFLPPLSELFIWKADLHKFIPGLQVRSKQTQNTKY